MTKFQSWARIGPEELAMTGPGFAKVATVALAASSLFAAPPAHAETELMLGGAAAFKPDYPGSNDYEAIPVPLLQFDWSSDGAGPPASGYTGEFGLIDARIGFPDGIDIGLARLSTPTRHFTFRVGGGYRFGRDQDDNHALNGMGDIGGQGLGRVSIGSEPANPRGIGAHFGLKYETDLTNETGADTFTLYVGNTFALSPSTTLALTGRTSWADDDYMQSYFGVSDLQAARSSHSRFDANSGVTDVGLDARLNYAFTDHWMLFGSVGYSRLTGDAADSPLVDKSGSPDQFRATTGFAYRF